MSEKSFKQKVSKLTYHDGRQYAPGETIEYAGPFAAVAAAHYGKALQVDPAEPDVATTKAKAALSASRAASAD